jgi:MoaA/NifB/PqqE/SkfB family radical SAM enzyme
MAFGPAWDASSDPTTVGVAATFVVPATECDLACPVCVIKQRGEAKSPVLTAADYGHFLQAAFAVLPVMRVCIQGYEPLLPESWDCTKALLGASRISAVPTSVITNGTHLSDRVVELEALDVGKLTVSLDSSDLVTNDRRRGRKGAFQKTVSGIERAVKSRVLANRVAVASILYPHGVEALIGMPEFLASVGIRRWSLSPLIRIGHDGSQGGFVESADRVKAAVEVLAREAGRYDLEFFVDDEFKVLDASSWTPEETRPSRRAIARAERLLRLDPQGGLSVGRDLLAESRFARARWIPGDESPTEFIQRAVPELIAPEPLGIA